MCRIDTWHRGREHRTLRWSILTLSAVAVFGLACERNDHASDRATQDTRSGLAAATGVQEMAVGADAQRPHIVPLGPMRGDVEILAGHPDSVGRPFVMRIRELPGAIVPPHTHPVDEYITVLAGTWYFGTGERFDSAALTAMPPGSYAFAPRGTTMFAESRDGAVVQVHGVGPFHIHWRNGLRMLSDSGTSATFRYHVDDAVTGARGPGRVRQGYASGALIQYEVVRPDGQAYMAREGDLRRQ